MNNNSNNVRVHEFKKQISATEISSSLIICTYNRPSILIKNLKDLVLFSDLPSEVIIVDGSNNLNSFDLVKDFLKGNSFCSNFIYILGITGLTLQRNIGISVANGKIIHFLDDDCFPENAYFETIEKIFASDNDIVGVTGNILNEFNVRPGLKYKLRCFLGIYKRIYKPGIYYCNGSSVPRGVSGPIKNDYEVDIASGASMSFKKDILVKAGCFSDFFSGYSQGEDLELSLRARKFGKIIQSYAAKCNHIQDPSSRPNLFRKGSMEVINRHYIWNLNINPKYFKCRLQFWGDIIFLNIYALLLFFKSGFQVKYINYFIGLFKGLIVSISMDKASYFECNNSNYMIEIVDESKS